MKTSNNHMNTPLYNAQDMSDSASNLNMNESSKRTLVNPVSMHNGNTSNFQDQDPSISNAQTAQWASQKEFLKMSSICQNKE